MSARIIYVDASAPTNSPPDGDSWATAFATVQAGLAAAQAGDEVWVAAGTYYVTTNLPDGSFALNDGVALYGGFSGAETNRDQRDWTNHATILDGAGLAAHVVTVAAGATNTTRIDGFTIRNGGSSLVPPTGGGIYFTNASPVIANNVITRNRADKGGGGIYCTNSYALIQNNLILQNAINSFPDDSPVSGGGGILCAFGGVTITNNVIAGNLEGGLACKYGVATIVANRIFGNHAQAGAGILCAHGAPEIAFNVIADNRAVDAGGGVEILFASPRVHNNWIVNNAVASSYGSVGGGGLAFSSCVGAQVFDNLILSNVAVTNSAFGGGGMLYYAGTSPDIFNNTLLRNQAAVGGAIYSNTTNQARLVNNLIVFNSSGIYSTNALDLRNNDLYGNGTNDLTGVHDPTGSNGNISADPQLVENDDFLVARLSPTSPCVDAGDSNVVQPDWVTLAGQPRIQGLTVDIGADESNGTLPPDVPQAVRVSPDGDDANDGSSWSQAKRTVQAAIDQAAQTGGQVWVASGFYPENLHLRMFTELYGGFSGAETNLAQRDWTAHPTILDGQQHGSVVLAFWIDRFAAVDGFTIQNGNAEIGGGIFCEASPIRIQFNTITGNAAVSGGGVACQDGNRWIAYPTTSSPWPLLGLAPVEILDNKITGNLSLPAKAQTANGAGIYLRASAAIADNLIADNTADNAALLRTRRPRGQFALEDYGETAGAAGIFCDVADYTVTIANNTILRNDALGATALGTAGAIYVWLTGSGKSQTNSVVGNNIIAFNSSGLITALTPILPGPTPGPVSILNNCLYSNGPVDYSGGLSNIISTNTVRISGNISTNPLVAGPPDGVHLFADSPCIDAGDTAVVQTGWVDIDGLPRIRGTRVDIGASELGWPRTWQPVMLGINAVSLEFVTAGGIAYARYSFSLDGCERLVAIGPVIRKGNDFSCDFDIRTEVGVLCPDLIIVKSGVIPIGALAPGDYTFTTTAWGRVVTTQPFTVPGGTGSTLAPFGRAADGSFEIYLNGIDGVSYVLEASSNLLDWTSLSTNSFGPLLLDPAAAGIGWRFYRVRIGP